MNKKIKRKVIFFSLLTFAIFACIAGYFLLHVTNELEEIRKEALGIRDLGQKEELFKKNPTIKEGVLLVDKFRLIKDYDKAFFYAKETIELGADKTPLGKFVHLWMAEIYNTTNKPDMARKHLEIALVLDDENLIQDNNWIEEAGLQDIFYSIREK